MALQILENNGIFFLEGNLNATTSRSFIIHFEYLINKYSSITINIGRLKGIDSNGVSAIKSLFANALRNQKLFSVNGLGSKDIYEDIQSDNAA
jgi:ABC-type transporter Mla MlaB component